MENYGVPEKLEVFWGIDGELRGSPKPFDFWGIEGELRIENGELRSSHKPKNESFLG